jgi:putative protein-disulfide isomerase
MHSLKQIIYVGDPMCSWCWGFAPELEKLRKHFEGQVVFSLCMGNLRNGHTWDDAFKQFLHSHWNDVAARTGQPFDTSLLERETFDYTTEPACRAVCTGRMIDESKAFALFERLQKAFYAEGRDITDADTLYTLAEETGYDSDAFTTQFSSDAMREQVVSDRYKSRAYGANAFPSLVLIDDEGHLSVIKGYRTYGDILNMIGS